jgi:hypothetical protein
VALIAIIAIPSIRGGKVESFIIIVAALMVNNGEAALFSFNGYGGIIWMFIAYAYWTAKE